jgi:hypothetical protein
VGGGWHTTPELWDRKDAPLCREALRIKNVLRPLKSRERILHSSFGHDRRTRYSRLRSWICPA